MESTLKDLVALDQDLGYEGEELREFVRQQQAEERNEHQARREAEAEARKLETKAEARRLEAEAEARKLEAAAEARRLEAEAEAGRRRMAEDADKRQFELDKLRLQNSSSGVKDSQDSSSLVEEASRDSLNWSAIVKIVPKFSETDVPKYFYFFEKLMKMLDCPPKYWTVLLQSVLVGKALEAYSSIDEEQSCDYEAVKDVILKAFRYLKLTD